MQKTKFSKINDQFNNLLFGFLSSSWKSKSINVISVLTGYFYLQILLQNSYLKVKMN